MNSIYLKWILIAIVILIVIGCITFYQLKLTTVDVTYEVVEIDNAPADIYAKYYEQKTAVAYSVYPSGNFNYIIITAGQFETAGFWLDVTDVRSEKGTLTIKTTLNAPEPDSFVAQVISFPAIVVKTSQSGGKFVVYTDEKQLLELK